MAVSLDSLCQTLADIAPLDLAEDWDNVGLLVGDRTMQIKRVMTCLTLSPDVADEALRQNADLVVTHHPIPFQPVRRITPDSITGAVLWDLIRGGVAIYSAHTAFDSAAEGINQTWAHSLGLTKISPIIDPTGEGHLGNGRLGDLPEAKTAAEIINQCAAIVSMTRSPRAVGHLDLPITRVGVACGSGGSFISEAHRCGCQLLITGEATLHACLEARSLGMALGLLGHYWSERFAMERLATLIAQTLPDLDVWASREETDPIIAPVAQAIA